MNIVLQIMWIVEIQVSHVQEVSRDTGDVNVVVVVLTYISDFLVVGPSVVWIDFLSYGQDSS